MHIRFAKAHPRNRVIASERSERGDPEPATPIAYRSQPTNFSDNALNQACSRTNAAITHITGKPGPQRPSRHPDECPRHRLHQPRPFGYKERRRATDIAAGSISSQKLYGTPVGLMFFEGAPRLRQAGVTIPGLQAGDPERIVVEAYPGVMARSFIGRRAYKHHTRQRQTRDQHQARHELLFAITSGDVVADYGLRVEAPPSLADDPTGDRLDALLCAVQAAWAWTRRAEDFDAPEPLDPLEGWIADPALADDEHRRNRRVTDRRTPR